MKKTILLFFVAILGIASAKAQNYDEENLLGTWVRTRAMTAVDDYLLSVDTLIFNIGVNTWIDEDNDSHALYCNGVFKGQWSNKPIEEPYSDSMADENYRDITNFAITNGNKLHIHFGDDFNLIFKIVSFTSTSLTLQPLGTNNSIYFTKQSSTNGVKGITKNKAKSNSYYNIEGQQTEGKGNGVTIVKPSNGSAYKVINK